MTKILTTTRGFFLTKRVADEKLGFTLPYYTWYNINRSGDVSCLYSDDNATSIKKI